MEPSAPFNARDYWDRRLEGHFDLQGVGYLRYGPRYNRYLYAAKHRAAAKVIGRHAIDVAGTDVLDLGCGTGFWLRWFRDRGASRVVGLDISPSAAEKLATTLPWATVRAADISEPWPVDGTFDIITAFDVLYHVVGEDRFEDTLREVSRRLVAGGWFLFTDRLGSLPDTASAAHVRFRDLDRYLRTLRQLGLEVQGVYGVYRFLNGGLADRPRVAAVPTLRRWVVRMENLLAPLLYLLDRQLATAQSANMRLVAVRKTG